MTKDFIDGYIRPDGIGMLITLCPSQYASNDIYSIQRLVLWQDLYRMPLKCRNMVMLYLLNALSDEYEFLNDKKDLIIRSSDNFWEKAYGELNIKEALKETFKEMDKEENNE